MTTVGKAAEESEPSCAGDENGKWCVCLENNLAAPQMIRHRVSLWPRKFTRRTQPGEINTYAHVKSSTWKCTEALFTIARKSEQLKGSSANEWVDKMWRIHTMKFYFTIKRNEVLTHISKWMNLKSMLSEEASYNRPGIVWLHSRGMSTAGKSRWKADQWLLGAGRGVQGHGYTVGVFFLRSRKCSPTQCRRFSTSVNMLKTTKFYTLNGWSVLIRELYQIKVFFKQCKQHDTILFKRITTCNWKSGGMWAKRAEGLESSLGGALTDYFHWLFLLVFRFSKFIIWQ